MEEQRGAAPLVRDPRTGTELTIEKRFEFDHSRMTMSVLTRIPSGDVMCYTKGAAERVTQRCKTESVPSGFDSVVGTHATQGCYVLAFATRNLGKLSSSEIADLTQDDVEAELQLMGLILFRNELKTDTAPAIAVLKGGDVRPVMITGAPCLCSMMLDK